MKNFLCAKIYKLLIDKPIKFITYLSKDDKDSETSEIIFNPGGEIKIVESYEGGGCGFSSLIIYEINIEGKRFKEIRLHRANSPIYDFVTKNEPLFQLISEI